MSSAGCRCTTPARKRCDLRAASHTDCGRVGHVNEIFLSLAISGLHTVVDAFNGTERSFIAPPQLKINCHLRVVGARASQKGFVKISIRMSLYIVAGDFSWSLISVESKAFLAQKVISDMKVCSPSCSTSERLRANILRFSKALKALRSQFSSVWDFFN